MVFVAPPSGRDLFFDDDEEEDKCGGDSGGCFDELMDDVDMSSNPKVKPLPDGSSAQLLRGTSKIRH